MLNPQEDKLSPFKIQKETVLILDNASVHRAKIIKERIPFWQDRGLFIAFLPPYSPHLNIAETVWRKLKKEWINPEDYMEKDTSIMQQTDAWPASEGRPKLNLRDLV
jgi:transposase